MRKSTALFIILNAGCILRPQFRPDEIKFSVNMYSWNVAKSGEVNAYLEVRNPTKYDGRLISVCDFTEDGVFTTTTETIAVIPAREIKIVRLNPPFINRQLTRRLSISCQHKVFKVHQTPTP